jgi:hypothetical protein
VSRDDVIQPFGWDVSRCEQLGTLPDVEIVRYPYRGFVDDLVECSARVLAFAGDSDLLFVGRSPECIFDLTSGALADTSWQDRLGLLNLSLEGHSNDGRAAARAIRPLFGELGLHPRVIERRTRPAALVDIVASGETLGGILQLLQDWCVDEHVPWRPVARRIRIVGLTSREKTSPKTKRWQQHADWVDVLRPASIKNVSIRPELCWWLAADVP